MAHKDTLVNTAIGAYHCYDVLSTRIFNDTNYVSPQYEHQFFAKNVGNVLSVYYYSMHYPKVKIEFRLQRYRIN